MVVLRRTNVQSALTQYLYGKIHAGTRISVREFRHWKVDARNALAYAAVLRERLADMHEAFAYPLIGALIGMPKLVVLDRPAPAYAPQILAVTETRAVFSTHTNAAAAHAFGRPHALAMTRA